MTQLCALYLELGGLETLFPTARSAHFAGDDKTLEQ